MGLKLGAAAALSDVGGAEDEEVVLTEKMGLKPEASRGLVLLLLLVAMTGFEAEEAAVAVAGALTCVPRTNGVTVLAAFGA